MFKLENESKLSPPWPSGPLVSHGQVHGTSAGGDADELRLLSTSSTYLNLRAYGGSLDFVSTKVGFCVSCLVWEQFVTTSLCVNATHIMYIEYIYEVYR